MCKHPVLKKKQEMQCEGPLCELMTRNEIVKCIQGTRNHLKYQNRQKIYKTG